MTKSSDRSSERRRDLATSFLQACLATDPPDAELRGSPAAIRLARSFAAAFPDARWQTEWAVTDEHHVVLGGRVRATHLGVWRGVPPTGRAVDAAVVLCFTLAGDTVQDLRVTSDTLAIAEQLGAAPRLGPRSCDVGAGT